MPQVVVSDTSAKPRHQNKIWDQVEHISSGAPRGSAKLLGARDVTIQLQLAIEEDPDRDLAEFFRLVRLGHFNDARAHYSENPKLGDGVLADQLRLAQMLLAAGDYKGLRQVTGKYHRLMENCSVTESWHLGARLNLVRLLFSQHQSSEGGENELLHLISKYTGILERAQRITLPEGNDWDFKDLFVAAVSLFGWEKTLIDFFGTTSDVLVLETILRDWKAPGYAESNTMCLLDLFTSLILQDPSHRMKARNLLLLKKARPLAKAVHRNEEQMMRTRPFLQWLLAKTVVEMDSPPGQMGGGRLGDKGGFVVNQGTGIHLPIYISTRSTNKPDWCAFSSKSSAAQCRAAEIAAAAAHYIGDYTTEATALKLLALQSHDPRKWVDALCHLQANIQGDNEGYVATSLSRYLLSRDEHEEADLLRVFQAPGGPIDLLSSGRCHYPQVMWALILIQMRLKAMDSETLLIGQRVFATVENGEPSPTQLSTVELGQIGDLVPRSLANYVWKEFSIPRNQNVEILINNKSLILRNDCHHSGEDDGGSVWDIGKSHRGADELDANSSIPTQRKKPAGRSGFE
ncbi:hypothetical protein N0V88_006675 [Collariella sp. IMI 366227]|nr:hypothetical protein N0V88_006675 [Collariella sp. IMI 366227]